MLGGELKTTIARSFVRLAVRALLAEDPLMRARHWVSLVSRVSPRDLTLRGPKCHDASLREV